MVDYGEVLADLRRRKAALKRKFEAEMAQLDAAVAAIEKMVPEQIALPGPVVARAAVIVPIANEKPFAGMAIREAARRCLEAHGRPMRAGEIAQALLDGGIKTDSRDFRTTVYSTLLRYPDEFAVERGRWSHKGG